MSNNELLDAALLYASLGWKVFPLRPKAKEPATKHGFKDATTDGDTITAWWTENPDYNVGIATGDGLCVIDVDDKDKNAIQGSDSLREWEIANGDIAETCRAMTGSGGVHYFYDVGDAEIPCCQSKSLAIDIRCDGGYVVAPPSVHPNGNGYVWDISPDDLAPAKVGETEKACVNWVYGNRNGAVDGKREKVAVPKSKVKEGEGRNRFLYEQGCSARAKGSDDDMIEIWLTELNKQKCSPPLGEHELFKIIGSVCTKPVGLSKEAEAEKKKPRRKRFEHNVVAKNLIEQRGACFIDGMPSVRVDGVYRAGWEHVDGAVLDTHDDATAHEQREVRHYLMVRAPRVDQSRPTLIAFENGVLDIETMELREPRASDVIPNVIPHKWNPDAKSPVVTTTLEKMAAGDPGTLDNLGEIIGLCMFRSARYGYCPILLGEGSNGKSTYIDMLHAVIGTHNMSALQPREIGQRFQAAQLIGKLANLGDDISNDYIDADSCSTIKKVATGSMLYTDVKGGDGFNFKPYCTMVFSANEFPRLGDSSYGMRRRLFPIAFKAKFTADDPDFDPNIIEKLTDEASCEYMCKLGVYSMLNVMRNGKLTDNAESRQIIDRIEIDNNTVLQWIDDECLERDYAIGKTASEVYGCYQEWCKRSGVNWVGSRKFSNVIGGTWHLKATKIDHRYHHGRRTTVKIYEVQS